MNINYVGPAKDFSGYGEATRHDIISLLDAQIGVTAKIPRYSFELSDFGSLGEIIEGIENKPLEYRIIILHTTPNVYHQFFEPSKYHIGRVFWETTKLPEDFIKNIQFCDEIWTGSEFNKQALRNSGITRPIYVIPQAVYDEVNVETIKPYKVANTDDYKFYSIFEWTERKNPLTLLTAFWQEFENTEGVSLTIKTYVDNFSKEKREEITMAIQTLKYKLGLQRYAPVHLYRNLMDREQIYRFHKTFDCFVSAHRGEGWGIPQMEALLVNNCVISTGCGGIHEYLENKKDAYLLPYELIQLTKNNRNQQWYKEDQQWADVKIEDVRIAMRYLFEHQEEAKQMGIHGGQTIKEKFAPANIGHIMKDRLFDIDKTLEEMGVKSYGSGS